MGTRRRAVRARAGHPRASEAWPLHLLPRRVCSQRAQGRAAASRASGVRHSGMRAEDIWIQELTGPFLEDRPRGVVVVGGNLSTERGRLRPREEGHHLATLSLASGTGAETTPTSQRARPRVATRGCAGDGRPAQLAALARPVVSNAFASANASSDWCRRAACALTSPGRVVAIKTWLGSACVSFSDLGSYGKEVNGVLRAGQGVGCGVGQTPRPQMNTLKRWEVEGGRTGLPRGSAGSACHGGAAGGSREVAAWPRDCAGAVRGPNAPGLPSHAGARAQPTCRWPGAGFVARPT